MSSSHQLFLLDAHALCYRAFYAIKGLTTSKGQPSNAVYGFVNTLRKLLREYDPQYLAVCFDSKGKTHRHHKFDQYKIQRPRMPEELVSQIPIIKKVVQAYNIVQFEREGYEADDIISTLARKLSGKKVEVVIVSDDKDMFQLVNDNVRVFSVRRDRLLDYSEIEEILGFEPKYIPDFIGLAGDKTDNIPGIPGIGKVTAVKLIKQYGDMAEILNNAENINEKSVRLKIQENQQVATLSRELAVLNFDVSGDFDLEKMKVGEPDPQKLFELFNGLEFRRFAEEYAASSADQPELAAVQELKQSDDVQPILSKIIKTGEISFFCSDQMEGQEEPTLFFYSKGAGVFSCSLSQADPVFDIFQNEDILKITYDIKEQRKLFSKHGCGIAGPAFDIMLAGYLLVPGQSGYDMASLAWNYLKTSLQKEAEPGSVVQLFFRLYELLKNELLEKDLMDLFQNIEMPLAEVLADMELEGVSVDPQLLQQLSQEAEILINRLVKKIHKAAGEEFNMNSPKQLSQILFEKLGLPVIKKTKTGFSTKEEVLKKLADQHPLPKLILDYRQVSKLKSTYIDALPKLINPHSGRIHAFFNQVGTETGRLSSNHPNLQNIPIRTELGRQIRKAFIPSCPENVILAADYSQIELRVLAHLSGDANLIKAFQAGEDIHRFTASQIFEVDEDAVTSDMRVVAKRVNFGIIYGISAFGLANDLSLSHVEAQAFIDRYFLRYPSVRKFMDEQVRLCEQNGYVTTLLNRRRYIPEIESPNIGIRQFAQRQAINTPVQGTAADLIKFSMVKIQNAIEQEQLETKMVITVHDELVFDMPLKEKERMLAMVREIMEGTLVLNVPVTVTLKLGHNWLEMEEFPRG